MDREGRGRQGEEGRSKEEEGKLGPSKGDDQHPEGESPKMGHKEDSRSRKNKEGGKIREASNMQSQEEKIWHQEVEQGRELKIERKINGEDTDCPSKR